MKSSANIRSSTQKFTEIQDIVDNVVLMEGGNACTVIEVQASNFALLSKEEQDVKIYSYASLLNSLSFPIQVLIRNKKLDISSYLTNLDEQAKKTPNEKLALQIRLYRDFVQEIIKVNTVLDKKFYAVISYSSLEKGAQAVINKQDLLSSAKTSLSSKTNALMDQIGRLNLRARILEKEELIKLFYEIYNEDLGQATNVESAVKAPIVKAQVQ